MSQFDCTCKVVLLGSANSGKTCLLTRYIHGEFLQNTETTVAGAFKSKNEEVGSVTVTLGCWDTAGSERYASISRMYYRNAKAAIICFDLTDRGTYDRARYWVSELLETEPDCKICVCGTKKDLIDNNPSKRAVNRSDARDLATDLQADYFETSSKTGENIDALFKKIAKGVAITDTDTVCNGNSHHESIKLSWKKDHRVTRNKSCCARPV